MQKPIDPTLKETMRRQMTAAGSMEAYAQHLQVTQDHLRKVYTGVIPPGSRLLKRLGLKKVTMVHYVNAAAKADES